MSLPAPVEILLVDDNPAKIIALQAALEPLGQKLVSATGGREALRYLLQRDFATVILDVHMPDIDGFETARLIRGRPRSAHTPIIFVSAVNLTEADALRGYSMGAVDYIFAPVIAEVLRAKVSVFVELHRKTEESGARAAELEKRARELEEFQGRLRLAERMAAIGTLSAGLGHDMGNLLLPARLRLDALDLERIPADLRDDIRAFRQVCTYLQRLSNGLRVMALDPSETVDLDESVSIPEWWAETFPFLKNALPQGVSLDAVLAPSLPSAGVSKPALTQAVFNLVQNAGEALSAAGHGNVRITAEHDPSSARVCIRVADDGPGMSPEVRSRCFEPFYTTKTRRLSTGLGLALVLSIVRNAGGSIEIDSEPGRGTVFSLFFPAVHPKPFQPGDKRPALVTVSDLRTRAQVISLLRTIRFDVTTGEAPGSAGFDCWVADAGAANQVALRAFVDSAPARRAVVLGADPRTPPIHPRITRLSGPVRFRTLRTAIAALAADE